jgi:hypothetical protein
MSLLPCMMGTGGLVLDAASNRPFFFSQEAGRFQADNNLASQRHRTVPSGKQLLESAMIRRERRIGIPLRALCDYHLMSRPQELLTNLRARPEAGYDDASPR